MENEVAEVERRVLPLGKLLNDNDTGVDQLGYLVYAQALAKLLHGCHPPLTVGIFGPWGIGKTFLLKHVQGLLRKYEHQQRYDAEEELKARGAIFKSRSAAHLEQTDTSVSAEIATTKPRNRTHKTNMRRGCVCLSCTLLSLLVVGCLCTLLIMVLIPSLRPYSTPASFPDVNSIEKISNRLIPSGRSGITGSNKTIEDTSLRPSGRIFDVSESVTSTTTSIIESTTQSEDEEEKSTIQGNLRLYLVLVSILFTGIIRPDSKIEKTEKYDTYCYYQADSIAPFVFQRFSISNKIIVNEFRKVLMDHAFFYLCFCNHANKYEIRTDHAWYMHVT